MAGLILPDPTTVHGSIAGVFASRESYRSLESLVLRTCLFFPLQEQHLEYQTLPEKAAVWPHGGLHVAPFVPA